MFLSNVGITHVFSCVNICRVPRKLFEHKGRNVYPSLNCLDTGRNYLRYLSQSYEEYIHVLACILTMNATVVAKEVHLITACILFNRPALYFIVYVTVCQIRLQINLGLCCIKYNQRISGSDRTLVWTGTDLRCLCMYTTLRILTVFFNEYNKYCNLERYWHNVQCIVCE